MYAMYVYMCCFFFPLLHFFPMILYYFFFRCIFMIPKYQHQTPVASQTSPFIFVYISRQCKRRILNQLKFYLKTFHQKAKNSSDDFVLIVFFLSCDFFFPSCRCYSLFKFQTATLVLIVSLLPRIEFQITKKKKKNFMTIRQEICNFTA